MTALTVDSLHARYRGASPDARSRLDAALAEVAGHGLAEALVGQVADQALRQADHVCIRRLTASTDLDSSSSTADLVRAWSESLSLAVGAAVAHAGRVTGPTSGHGATDVASPLEPGAGDGVGADAATTSGGIQDEVPDADVVVFPRTADAIVDLVRGVAQGDLSRRWAWRMVGLIGPSTIPDRTTVADVLIAHAEDVPVVWARTSNLPALPLTARGWLAVARSVARLQGESGTGGSETSHPGRPGGIPVSLGSSAVALARQLPWSEPDPRRRTDLAVLLLTCTHPTLAADPEAVAHTTDTWVRLAGAPSAQSPHPDAPQQRPEPSPHVPAAADSSVTDARDGHEKPPDPSPLPPTPPQPEPLTSRFGGLLLLVRPLGDVVDRLAHPAHPLSALPVEQVLARLAARLAGAPADDPAVRCISGWPADEPVPEGDLTQQEALDDLVADTRRWLTDQLAPDPGADGDSQVTDPTDAEALRWFWDRPVTLLREPGWLEARFGLGDVDLRIRRAGLDLDPGYVWWLGSVVRYRYV